MSVSYIGGRCRRHGVTTGSGKGGKNILLVPDSFGANTLNTGTYSPLLIATPAANAQHDGTGVFERLQELLSSFDNIKYAAYRMAKKVQLLQSALCWDRISLDELWTTFHSSNLSPIQNSAMMNESEAKVVIDDLLKCHVAVDERIIASGLTMETLLKTYCRNTSPHVKVSQVKVLLTILCSSRLREKLLFLYRQFADHNNCIKRHRLASLLDHISLLAEFLGEGDAFGRAYIADAVQSCFKESQGVLGVTEECFISWLMQEPQLIVWWSTLYRMESAIRSIHHVQCNSCGVQPCRGLRYQCLRCLSFNLCQQCFMMGKSNGKHKLKHPIIEHCTAGSTSNFPAVKTCMKLLWSWLKPGKYNGRKQRYLPLKPHTISTNEFVSVLESYLEEEKQTDEVEDKVLPLQEDGIEESDKEFWEQLQQLMRSLEIDINHLHQQLPSTKPHRGHIVLRQLKELHTILCSIRQDGPKDLLISSTPSNQIASKITFKDEAISPILSPERDPSIGINHFPHEQQSSLTFKLDQNNSYRVVVHVPFDQQMQVGETCLKLDKYDFSSTNFSITEDASDCWIVDDWGEDPLMRQCQDMFNTVVELFPKTTAQSVTPASNAPFLEAIYDLGKALSNCIDNNEVSRL